MAYTRQEAQLIMNKQIEDQRRLHERQNAHQKLMGCEFFDPRTMVYTKPEVVRRLREIEEQKRLDQVREMFKILAEMKETVKSWGKTITQSLNKTKVNPDLDCLETVSEIKVAAKTTVTNLDQPIEVAMKPYTHVAQLECIDVLQVSGSLNQGEDRVKTLPEEKLKLSLGNNIEHLEDKDSQKILNDLSFSQKTDRLWEPGGKMDLRDSLENESRPYQENLKLPLRQNVKHLEGKKDHEDATTKLIKPLNEVELSLGMVVHSSCKNGIEDKHYMCLSCDDHVHIWEPGGLPIKLDMRVWRQKYNNLFEVFDVVSKLVVTHLPKTSKMVTQLERVKTLQERKINVDVSNKLYGDFMKSIAVGWHTNILLGFVYGSLPRPPELNKYVIHQWTRMELMKSTETMIINEFLGNAYHSHGEDVLLIVRIEVHGTWSFVQIIKALTTTNDNKRTRSLIQFMTRKQPTEMGLNSHIGKMTVASKIANIDHGLSGLVECVCPIIFMLAHWEEQPPDIATWKICQECGINGYRPKLLQITRKEMSPHKTPFTPKKLPDQATCEVYQDLLGKYPSKVKYMDHGCLCSVYRVRQLIYKRVQWKEYPPPSNQAIWVFRKLQDKFQVYILEDKDFLIERVLL